MKYGTGTAARSMADGVGLLGSALCALHCLAAPTLLVSGTVIPASFLEGELLHQVLLVAILPAGLVAFGLGCKRHRDLGVILLGASGLIGLTLAGTVLHDLVGESGERLATLASAALLIAGHYRNFTLCRRCRDCHTG